MKERLSKILLLTLLLIPTRPLYAAQQRPLTERDLLALLAGGVYSSRIAALVEERGITFVVTPADLEQLRKAGAEESLEHAVEVAPRITPREASNHPKPPSVSRVTPNKPLPASTQIGSKQLVSSKPMFSQPSADTEAGIPAGTTINMANWVKYQRYMPVGMVQLFEGNYFWKMPRDVEINVGPTATYSLPKGYNDATRKYSEAVRIVHLANGHSDIQNYRGGLPFPDPQEPDKGYKLLADLWFTYTPHVLTGTERNPLTTCSQDSHSFINCARFSYVFRQLAYNTDPGVTANESNGLGSWYTQWLSIEQPEQLRYTTILTLYPRDNQQQKDLFTFVPGLRRWIRGSLASRCSPIPGTDYVQDDYKTEGFSGGIGAFTAQFLGHQRILALTGEYAPLGGNFPANYYMPLGWPKPSWGKWQLRDDDVIDVRPVPDEKSTYCYGKRVLYEDSSMNYVLWEDAYDTKMRLWKTALLAQRTVDGGTLGTVPAGLNSSAWDLINGHMTNTSTEGRDGVDAVIDDNNRNEDKDLISYSTPAGLTEILK
jgi:hypothetical protein